MLSKAKRIVLVLLITTACMAAIGCSVGVKEKTTYLFVSPVPIPEAAKGAPVIATNEKIEISTLSRPEIPLGRQKITGYVVVDPWFYDLLIKAWNESRKK